MYDMNPPCISVVMSYWQVSFKLLHAFLGSILKECGVSFSIKWCIIKEREKIFCLGFISQRYCVAMNFLGSLPLCACQGVCFCLFIHVCVWEFKPFRFFNHLHSSGLNHDSFVRRCGGCYKYKLKDLYYLQQAHIISKMNIKWHQSV